MISEVRRNGRFDWIENLPEHFLDYLKNRRLEEVECIVPDLAGMSRGKAMPADKFNPDGTLFLPVSLFYQTISGEYVRLNIADQWTEKDVVLKPDMTTASAVPWANYPTMQVICDIDSLDGSPLSISPRNVLRRVVSLYSEQGWRPVVAPELEFYLTKPNTDSNEPIEPPLGRTGRKGVSRHVCSMATVDEYGTAIDTIYDFAEAQGLSIDTVTKEDGAGQIEFNLPHGDPLLLADQVFYFKRAIREAALKNGIFATFMAKPIRGEPGSAMHLHQSVVCSETGTNIFTDSKGCASDLFHHFLGGSQAYLSQIIPLLAPYVNSYRRIVDEKQVAPANLEWAEDNRTVGLRVPRSIPDSRRLENRVIGMDCNPYLAIAASLACGYLGMMNAIKPRPAVEHAVRGVEAKFPITLSLALAEFESANEVWSVLGEEFCRLYHDVKIVEDEDFRREISPWERQHLLLNV